MFTLLYLNNAVKPLVISVSSPGRENINLQIGPLIGKRNKVELAPEYQFAVLNGYVDYKGSDFKNTLYLAIYEANLAVEESSFQDGLSNPPTIAIHHILNMFDMEDVLHYVRDIHKVVPPVNLEETFDPLIESDGLGTRFQTYIQSDYYELAALTVPIKAVIGLLGQYFLIKSSRICIIHKEYVLYGMISGHAIVNHPAMIKLGKWVDLLINLKVETFNTVSVTVIEKQIPSSELVNYILAVIMIQKLSTAAIVTDSRERNIITLIYNYVINKLKTRGGSNNKIRDKRPGSDVDSNDGDKESIVESYRIVSEITPGIEAELCWYTENMDLLIRDIKTPIDMLLLAKIHKRCQCFRTIPIAREQIILAGYVFKSIIDPRSLYYISIEGIINIISLGFVILWGTNHRELALILTAKQLSDTSDDIDINISPNVRIDSDIKKELERYYPYEKRINKVKTESVIEAAITELTYSIFKHKWVPNAPRECVVSQFKNEPVRLLVPEFKMLLANLAIDLNKPT